MRRPEFKEFIDMGLGIESRYQLCKEEWDKHIDRTKAYQRQCIKNDAAGDSIAVLGAGRLYDVDFEALCERFERIALFDADPSVMPFWRKLKKSGRCQTLEFHIVDLTSSMESWTVGLGNVLRGPANKRLLIEHLKALRCDDNANPVGQFDTVLSVNLLGQIPLYWRDRAYRTIPKYWQLPVGQNGFEEEVQRALASSLKQLQLNHLKLLAKCAAKKVILISDINYAAVRNNVTYWREPALYFDWQNISLAEFRGISIDAWNWMIGPQYKENRDYGALHEVRAWEFQKVAAQIVYETGVRPPWPVVPKSAPLSHDARPVPNAAKQKVVTDFNPPGGSETETKTSEAQPATEETV